MKTEDLNKLVGVTYYSRSTDKEEPEEVYENEQEQYTNLDIALSNLESTIKCLQKYDFDIKINKTIDVDGVERPTEIEAVKENIYNTEYIQYSIGI